jgi:hypothetical protein
LFNPSATTTGKSQYLWELEQPAQAVANGVFIGALRLQLFCQPARRNTGQRQRRQR